MPCSALSLVFLLALLLPIQCIISKGEGPPPLPALGGDHVDGLPPTWQPVYQDVLTELYMEPPEEKPVEALLAFWMTWNKCHMLRYRPLDSQWKHRPIGPS